MASFRKLKSGMWQARVFRNETLSSIGVFKTKKEAEITAAKVEERIYYGQTISDKNVLFSDIIKEWLIEKKQNVKESTYEQIEAVIKLHILPAYGNKKIIMIKRADIKRWLNHYATATDKNGKQKYASGSRLKYLSTLKSILYYAVHELEVLEKNPADRLKIPVSDKVAARTTTKYYSLKELNSLLEYMKSYRHQRYDGYQIYYMLMYFLSQTGLRISESLALKWSDIEENRLTVERQTRRTYNNEVQITTLKNSSSYRTIMLSDELLRALKKFKINQSKMILANQSFTKNDDGIIFQNYLGNYLTPSTVRDSIRDYCKKAGVAYKGTHCFRHTHAVLLLEAGASIKFVANRLGHKTIKTTADTYLDVTEKIEKDELEKFALYMNGN